LSDSVFAADRPTHYQWLQLVPGVLIAKLFSAGPAAISIVWRIWAGISIAIGWYLLCRFYTRKTGWAFLISVVLLADCGLLAARPIWGQVMATAQIASGHTDRLLGQYPRVHREWRIITPGLSLAYLLFHIWLVARAREISGRRNILLAGASLGLLFYAYFFYWTAACLALAIVFAIDQKNRKAYWYTGLIGVLLGLPALLSTFLLKRAASPDWGMRTDLGIPIPRFSELMIPKIAILLLAIMFVWIWKQRRDLIYVWALALSGILLANHQIFTAMQLENEHWTYVWGPCISFLLILWFSQVCSRFSQSRPALVLLCMLVFLHCLAGLWLRAVEGRRTQESTEDTAAYREYSAQQKANQTVWSPNAVIAGDRNFVYVSAAFSNLRPLDHYAAVMSPWISDSELDTRVALNGFLRGLDRSAFAAEQKKVLEITYWGQEARSPARKAQRLASRLEQYDEIAANPLMFASRFDVKYVALESSLSPPLYLQQRWHELAAGPYWQVWERF